MRKSKWSQVLVMAAAYSLFVVLIFPYIVMLVTAMKPRSEVYNLPTTFFPVDWTLLNFVEIWTRIPLANYFLNSLAISVGAMLLTLVSAVPAAYVMTRFQFKGRNLMMYIIIVTQMFSPIVLLVGLYREIHWLGLMDSVWGLILINTAFCQAFAVWILRGYFATIPKDLEQAAWIDGCTKFGAVWRVMLPLAAPGIITATIFVFIMSWNEFVVALTLISTETKKPITVGIYAFFGKYDVQWQYLFATSLVATIPVVALFLSIEKYLVEGLTTGGVKH
ncbi:carbohydrate ABC transporter permease [Paenibacillus senegalensis]|uniref:carbohydrate ABC transporter permease n=1 Tax=Paenibacillus senegalensis TaxID=1465766 RepID=UPI000288F2F4|nr:carbohydrate ABC transporter permease [Paenibacillus senegalensis]